MDVDLSMCFVINIQHSENRSNNHIVIERGTALVAHENFIPSSFLCLKSWVASWGRACNGQLDF